MYINIRSNYFQILFVYLKEHRNDYHCLLTLKTRKLKDSKNNIEIVRILLNLKIFNICVHCIYAIFLREEYFICNIFFFLLLFSFKASLASQRKMEVKNDICICNNKIKKVSYQYTFLVSKILIVFIFSLLSRC